MEEEDTPEGKKAKYFRLRGNHYFNIQDYDKALHCYKMGISFDETNSVLYSNKSQAHLALHLYTEAEDDAKKAVELDVDNPKGYFRAAKAAAGLGNVTKAMQYLNDGLRRRNLTHNSELKNYLDELLEVAKREKCSKPKSSVHGNEDTSTLSTPTTPIKNKENKDPLQNETSKSSEIKAGSTEPAQSSKSKGKTNTAESRPSESKTSNRNKENNESKVGEPKTNGKGKGKTGPIESKDIAADKFLQTVETVLPKLQAPTQVQKRKMLLEFFATVKDGSELLLKGLTKTAATKYMVALDILVEYPPQCLDLGRMEEIILKYAISWCWLQSKDYQSMAKAIEYLNVIREKHASQLPAVYFALGNSYLKLNRFHNASKSLEKGLSVIRKKHQFESYSWPGTKTIIKETTSDGLQESIMELLPICKQFHPPDAICKYDKDKCFTISNQIVPSESIFFSDPDFVGFVVIICQMKCKIQYHLACWKDLKDYESDATGGKVSDKDMLGWPCPTDDCVTANADRSVIVGIQVVGEDGVIKSQCEREPPAIKAKVDASDVASAVPKDTKKPKKKTEKVKSTTTTTSSTTEKEKPKLKPRPSTAEKSASPARPSAYATASRARGATTGDQYHRGATTGDQYHRDRATMDRADADDEDNCEELEDGRDSDEYIIQRIHARQLGADDDYHRDIWQPTEAYYGREDLDPDMWFMSKSADACQDFIFSFFYDFLTEDGPQPVSEIEERWESEKGDCQQYRDLANRDDFPGIISYLSASFHFVVVNDYIGTCAQAPDIFELAVTDISDCFEFLIKDYAPAARPEVAGQKPRGAEVAKPHQVNSVGKWKPPAVENVWQKAKAVVPEVAKPKAALPEVAKPKAAVPEVAKPKAAVPEVAKPKAALPEVAKPKAAVPEVAKPKAALPEVAKPKAALPEVAKPKAALPEVAKPKAAVPEVAKPKAAVPEVAKPKAALSEVTKPCPEPKATDHVNSTATKWKPVEDGAEKQQQAQDPVIGGGIKIEIGSPKKVKPSGFNQRRIDVEEAKRAEGNDIAPRSEAKNAAEVIVPAGTAHPDVVADRARAETVIRLLAEQREARSGRKPQIAPSIKIERATPDADLESSASKKTTGDESNVPKIQLLEAEFDELDELLLGNVETAESLQTDAASSRNGKQTGESSIFPATPYGTGDVKNLIEFLQKDLVGSPPGSVPSPEGNRGTVDVALPSNPEFLRKYSVVSPPLVGIKSETSSDDSYRSVDEGEGQRAASPTDGEVAETKYNLAASEFRPRDVCPPAPTPITNPFWADTSILNCPTMFQDPLVAVEEAKVEPKVVQAKVEPKVVQAKVEPKVVQAKVEPKVVQVKVEPPPRKRTPEEYEALSRSFDVLDEGIDRLAKQERKEREAEIQPAVVARDSSAVSTHKHEILSDSKTCQTELTNTDIEELIQEWDNAAKIQADIAALAKPVIESTARDCQTDLTCEDVEQLHLKLEATKEENKTLVARMKSADEVTLILLDVRKKADAENHRLREEGAALTSARDELVQEKARLFKTNAEVAEAFNKLRDEKGTTDRRLAEVEGALTQQREKADYYKGKFSKCSQELKTLKMLHLKLVTEFAEMKVSECDEKYRMTLMKLQDARQLPDVGEERAARLAELHQRLGREHKETSAANNEVMARYARLRLDVDDADLERLPKVKGADIAAEYHAAVSDVDTPAPCCPHRCGSEPDKVVTLTLPLALHFRPDEGAVYRLRPGPLLKDPPRPPPPQQQQQYNFPPRYVGPHPNFGPYPAQHPQHVYPIQMPQYRPYNVMPMNAYSGQPVFTGYRPQMEPAYRPPVVNIKNPNLINEIFGEKGTEGGSDKQHRPEGGDAMTNGDRARSNSLGEAGAAGGGDKRGGVRDPHCLPKLQNVVPIDRDAKDFTRLLEELKKRHPLHSMAELQKCVETVRDRDDGLSGMPFLKINALIANELDERAKAKKNAWGQVKPDVATWKPERVEEDCVICMDKMAKQKAHTLDCQHTFHLHCIKLWLGRNSVCPMCNRHSKMSDEYPPLK